MTMPGNHPRRYRIIIAGDVESLLSASLDGSEVTSLRGWTSVSTSVPDESAFYGLLDRLQDLALQVVSLNELSDDPPPDRLRPADKAAEAWLDGAAAHDPAALEPALSLTRIMSGLDRRSHILVRLAGLVALGTDVRSSAYRWHVADALDGGITIEEIVGVLIALLPTAGTARVTAAASALRDALGDVLGSDSGVV
ncbi:MAG: carboxymuconolactone decarboxylase family protein [Actinomycetota bacterium]|nr:carboxymuconolactone decarboxylase family protein [Actinomycetota bacterium]